MTDVGFALCVGEKAELSEVLCNDSNVGGGLYIGELYGGRQLAPIHVAGVKRAEHFVCLIQPFRADDAFDAFLPGVILSLTETELDITVAVGRSAEPGKSLLDCDFFSGEQKQFGAAVVADLRAGKAVFVVVFGEGLTVVYFGQLVAGIVDEQTFFGDLRQPSVDEILADGSVFRIILVMGRNGAFRIHHILSADLSIVADIFAQREVVEVEGQIDEILLGGVFQLGDADKELIVFVVVEALHPPGEVVQLVQIGEAVFQHGEFLRPVDLCHKG